MRPPLPAAEWIKVKNWNARRWVATARVTQQETMPLTGPCPAVREPTWPEPTADREQAPGTRAPNPYGEGNKFPPSIAGIVVFLTFNRWLCRRQMAVTRWQFTYKQSSTSIPPTQQQPIPQQIASTITVMPSSDWHTKYLTVTILNGSRNQKTWNKMHQSAQAQ